MARNDALGFFWQDEVKVKAPKAEKEKRTPPPRTWEDPSYLPYIDEARAFNVDLFDADSIYQSFLKMEELEWDMEVYGNYTAVGFRGMTTGKVAYYESFNDQLTPGSMGPAMLKWIVENFQLVGFNTAKYDLWMLAMVLAGKQNAHVKIASDKIIVEEMSGYEVAKQFRVKPLKDINSIDLLEVAPSFCSLKLYAGRMFQKRMQDLPFHPSTILTWDQALVVRWYMLNDLNQTGALYRYMTKQMALRVAIGNEHGIDLRSKSDAQIAEAVIASELRSRGISRPQAPMILPGTVYYYNVPSFLKFQTPNMQWVLDTIRNTQFIVGEGGNIGLPPHLKELLIPIGKMKYQMGIGGLHSTEKKTAHIGSADMLLLDTDVESYYPRMMLNLGIYPAQIGPVFLHVFGAIVDRRVQAKRRKDKVTADSLKITINGTYGKLGSKYSFLYTPDGIIQVTLTGQLGLLMLIERLEMYGFEVVSANTDGLVTKVPTARRDHFNAIVEQWRDETGYNTEETEYLALYSRDVNNYLAVKKGGYKAKGVFANPWDEHPDINDKNEQLKHNPANLICIEAAVKQVTEGVLLEKTIRECTDIRKFTTVRTVSGGACKVWSRTPAPAHSSKEDLCRQAGYQEVAEGMWQVGQHELSALPLSEAYEGAKDALCGYDRVDYLGKAIRWYYAKGIGGELVAAKTGNRVPKSKGAMPLMELPDTFPTDVDYEWYEEETRKILRSIAFMD